MTSVPNRRRQLNGNKLWLILAGALLVLQSCALFKSADAGKKKRETPDIEEDKDRVYNPETGHFEYVDDARSLVDTLVWQEAENAPDPITDRPPLPVRAPGEEIALLIPLHALDHQYISEVPDARTRRFLHFYSGAKLAMEDLQQMGYGIMLKVFDTESSAARIDQLIKSRQLRKADLIIGPYEKDNIEEVATFGDKNRIPVVSPWHPGSRTLKGHPWLVQATPGFVTHVKGIQQYIAHRYPAKKVVLVGRDNASEKGRIDLFRSTFEQDTAAKSGPMYPEILIIKDASADLAETDLTRIFAAKDTTIFVLPHFSNDEENFVLAFLRKLHASKGQHEVIVFGLPQWTNYQKLNYDYLESLRVHISSNYHIDRSNQTVRDFEKRFFDTYGTVPESSAFQGYDVVRFFGGLCAESGRAMLEFVPQVPESLLAFSFLVRPVARENSTSEPSPLLEYYENEHVMILRFKDQAFQKVP